MDSQRPHRYFLLLLCLAALVFATANTVLSLLDTAALADTSFVALPATAATLGLLSLGTMILFATLILSASGDAGPLLRKQRYVIACCIFTSIISLCISLGSYVRLDLQSSIVFASTPNRQPCQTFVRYILWGLSACGQGLVYIYSMWYRRRGLSNGMPILPSDCEDADCRMSDIRQPTSPMSPQAMSKPFIQEVASPSRTFSRSPSQSFESIRSSLNQIVRPVTSRTRLIGRPSTSSRAGSRAGSRTDSRTGSAQSDTSSLEKSSRANGFDSWDTSSVEQHLRDALLPSTSSPSPIPAPSRGTALEPIPGSRPASPARALDGPFPESPETYEDEELAAPPRICGELSRSGSPALSEAHIHPLFRSDSPTPPTIASPGTMITAAPQGGYVMARPLSRRPTNESLYETQSRSNSGVAGLKPSGYS